MNPSEVPGYKIVEDKIREINNKIVIEDISYDFDRILYKFKLSNNNKTCSVLFNKAFLDDLNDYTGSKQSKCWLALKSNLKKRLSITMQISGVIPFSSDIFFEEIQDWEQDNGHNIEVCFSESDYEIFQDGLKELYYYLESQGSALSHLKLKKYPYEEYQNRIKDMLRFRNEQISKYGPCNFRDRLSVPSRIHLKAAALRQLMLLEKEILQVLYSGAVKKEIANKICKILSLLSSPIFEKIEVAEYLYRFRDETISDQCEVTMPDNTIPKKYDVVISFAGEDRDHAEKLADLLKEDNFEIFYDKYEEHVFWGKNLYEHLTEVYSKRSKYCVMFLSKHYAAKQWPTLERKAAQERAFKENREYILPIRIDDTGIPGILDTVAYQDLREKRIEEIYSQLKRKLLSSEDIAVARSKPDVKRI